MIDVEKELKKDTENIRSIISEYGYDSKQHDRATWRIIQKYSTDLRISSKGVKTIKSLLKSFWDGRKMSQKELLMIYGMGTMYMVSTESTDISRSFLDEVTEELKSYGLDREDVKHANMSGYLLSRGMSETNPYFQVELLEHIMDTLEIKMSDIHG